MSLFSIIIPAYNNSSQISRAIKSIKTQSFTQWELIIINDGSTDNTANIIESFLSDPRIKYFKQENKGVTAARNAGALMSNFEYIAFLDGDDEVEKTWLEDFAGLLKNSPSAGYLSCGYFRNNKKQFPKYNYSISNKKYSSLAGTFLLRRDVFIKIGGYDPVLKQSENWEMTARALEYCKLNNLPIEHTDKLNFRYDNYPSPAQTKLRDEFRGDATYYLYHKYKDGGVLHYKKFDFLLSSAVNYTRAGKFKKSRQIFYENLKINPTIQNLVKVIIFEIPVLRRKIWMRKNSDD